MQEGFIIMNKGGKFLWCCVCMGYHKIIWFKLHVDANEVRLKIKQKHTRIGDVIYCTHQSRFGAIVV